MADTATLDPQQAPETPAAGTSAAGTTVVQAAPEAASGPVPETPAPRRGRTRAVPLLVHGTNATGTTLGAAYTAAGVPGLAAAAGVGAAVGLAALAGRRRKSAGAARRAVRDAARNRSGTGSGGGGGGRSGRGGGLLGTVRGSGSSGRGSRVSSGGAGSSGGRMNNRSGGLNGRAGGLNGRSPGAPGAGRGASGRSGNAPGSPGSPGGPHSGLNKNGGRLNTSGGGLNKNSGGLNGTGPGRPGGSGGGKNGDGSPNGGRHRKNGSGGSGGAWQSVKSTLGKLRRRDMNNNGGTANTTAPKTPDPAKTSKTPKTPKAGGRSRVSRMLNTARSWMNRLRRTKKAEAAAKGGSGAPATKTAGRVYRWRRLVLRKTGHWARCAGAGLLAALAGLATLPLGVLWGTWRLITKHRDPLHGYLFPVRIAGRIWRRFFRRSRARHDADARAETLNLTVNDPRKDTDTSMGSSLDTSSAVLDGKNSKFALAMSASHASYAGYRPRSMMEVAAEYAGLPNALRATAATVRDMAVASDSRYPCSKRALVKLAEAAQRSAGAAARADDMVVLFRAAHAFDIERILHPRTGEWMWNVTPNGAAVPAVMFMPGRIESGCVLMSALYRTFEPVHMMQVGAEYEGMSLGLTSLADSVSLLHTRTRDVYPVDDRVTDELGTITATLRAAADDAAMAAKLFAHDHRREISHNVNPRKGRSSEEMWNTPR